MSAAPSTSPLRTLGIVAADVKLAHSIFALPFAPLAAFMAAAPPSGPPIVWRRFGGQLTLVVLAMVLARGTTAMLANRLIDREIDAANPRTAGRALPSGRLSIRAAVTWLVIAAALFMLVCVAFGVLYDNWWPSRLGLPVLGWISVYAFLKRFTRLCHLYLGSSLAISPLAAAIAVDPAALTTQPALWLLSGMVLCWVAGFDIIYALQDVDADRAQRLFSIPGGLGVTGALRVSRLLHLVALGCLAAAGFADPRLSFAFGSGVVIVAGLLVYEHATVSRWGTTRLALAFFTLNGVISCVLGVLGSLDVVLR